MTSKKMRSNPLFMRNEFDVSGRWEIPVIHKQKTKLQKINLIACSDTKPNDLSENKLKGVHFFVDDYRFNGIYDHPERTLTRYSQYAFLLSPDYSIYNDMSLWLQLINIAKSRWVGAYWQSKGLVVIPTVSWGLSQSFEFCFDGIEQYATVAIGMVGCKHSKLNFLRGYNAMLEKLSPSKIICYGSPFKEMDGNIVIIDYIKSRKAAR